MDKHILVIRQIDKVVFNSIKDGTKSIETRAATDKYKKIKVGDTLFFKCGSEILEKKIISIRYFRTINEMINTMDFKRVMPFVNSVEEMEKIYYSFPGYKEKIKKFGLVAFEL